MDETFESGLLAIVDDALLSPPTTATFRRTKRAYREFDKDGTDRATAHVKHPLFERGHFFDVPAEYAAALAELLPRERAHRFNDVEEHMAWTVCDEFELTEQDRADGYRSLDEFWQFLRDWRDRYRRDFGR